ncbi:hypothetical protein DB347_08775 [Opitutaceae bacterium EW11]|nr:hypothetical protein DB347_08775 [Opitutaceae bacterium EW11]
MKTYPFRLVLLLAATLTSLVAGPRDADWRGVDEAVNQGLPKTAIERLEPILAAALANKAYPEAVKALTRKIALEGNIQGSKPEEKIVRLQSEIEKTPPPMKPAMEAILAHWYWQYFQANRWRFIQRTQTAAGAGEDLQTWDLARILTEIDRHFAAALADSAALKATPVREYDALITRGDVPDRYRPTLFDFLANEALVFYQSAETGAIAAEDAFELEADGPIFSNADDFIQWQPGTGDTASPKRRAVELFQELLKFHQTDSDRSAFLDVDLARLSFGHNSAVGAEKTERYKAALERFIVKSEGHEISARALFLLATQLNEERDPTKAHELAHRGWKAFPNTAGGAQCFNLLREIEARSAQLETEAVWNAPWPTLNVTYRNVTHVYFRAIPVDFADYIGQARWSFGVPNSEYFNALRTKTPILAWDAALPPTADFKSRTEKIPAPTSLRPGFYAIVASFDRGFSSHDNQINTTLAWVSDLALVLRTQYGGKNSGGFVLNAVTGEPIVGATIRCWQRNREGWYRPSSSLTTDKDGQFHLQPSEQPFVLVAEHAGNSVASVREFNVGKRYPHENDDSRVQTVFFTDRSLYRPGQTISFKGLCLRADPEAADYKVLGGIRITVVFTDPNGKEIARSNHQTNDYGSFSGAFTAPRDRLLGQMSIRVEHGPRGFTSFNVEEYKRPKFQVELHAPVQAAKLSEPVTLTGKATAYTGAAIGGAKVKWRVERSVRLPYWCWWWRPPAKQAIAHGVATTEADGTFTVAFTAKPDRSVPEKTEPVFVFNAHADVTDTTGETRSDDQLVRAGYTALQASLTAGEWLTTDQPVGLDIATQSLDATPQSADGIVTIHALKQPAAVQRKSPASEHTWRSEDSQEPKLDPARPESWENGDTAAREKFRTDADGKAHISAKLGAGIYRATLETTDRFGKKVTAQSVLQVTDPRASRLETKVPDFVAARDWSVEPGTTFTGLWGTGYPAGRAFVEIECRGQALRSYWTSPDRTQTLIEQAVTEELRGGFTVRITHIQENRAYLTQRVVNVPWSNKELTIKWESFRSKLAPGQKETWIAEITGRDARKSGAEMVAALYDASLDQFQPHAWNELNVFRTEQPRLTTALQNESRLFQTENQWEYRQFKSVSWMYRSFPDAILDYGESDQITLSPFSVRGGSGGYMAKNTLAGSRMRAQVADSASVVEIAMPAAPAPGESTIVSSSSAAPVSEEPAAAPKPNLDAVVARKNLNETAFFFPQLRESPAGVVRIEFTMPEALTQWKFLGFAHDQDLRNGLLTGTAVTSKELMVEPNPPRFLREGDTVEFAVKVTNQSDKAKSGTVRLTFADAATLKPADADLGNRATEQPFVVPAGQSRSYSWRIAVPDGLGFLTYKAVASTGNLSDGEEGFLPVLSRRIPVTESLPLPIRGPGTKNFEFEKLIASGGSDTLRHQSLTVQMVSQPAWYAVMALPYLMEYPYECSEQVFNRLYANALARRIANSDPKIRRIFDLWKNTPALDSPLEKNQDLKSVLVEETPWLRQAQAESQARRNVGLLFDGNRLDEETSRTLAKLSERQLSDGLWSWFPGGRPSEYISLYIMTGFGRLRQLGVEIDQTSALKSLAALDAWIEQRHRDILKHGNSEDYVPSPIEALYLYGRSFYLKDEAVAPDKRAAVDYFLGQARKHWLKTSRQSQAHLALALQRFGDAPAAQAIVRSLKERSVTSEELGMFWRDQELSWWWYHAPIETQALMIEAFAEIANDAKAVEDCKVWLLKQKQTQDWKTTKATADAIYGLLLRGDDLLSRDSVVEVDLGGRPIRPEKVEAGTGFYEQRFPGSQVTPEMGHVTVKKADEGVSWGSLHWQYLEDIAKVPPHEGTPLMLKKTLFVKETTKKGPVLKPVNGAISVGDELVVRIELRTDRDMEYVHLKDQRGSGTEPVNVLSRYRYQDGLGYYETTRDTATHFFIDYLPKGTYVFEYSTRVQLRGVYQSGIAEIQCMYAPEFNSHSASTRLEVK